MDRDVLMEALSQYVENLECSDLEPEEMPTERLEAARRMLEQLELDFLRDTLKSV